MLNIIFSLAALFRNTNFRYLYENLAINVFEQTKICFAYESFVIVT